MKYLQKKTVLLILLCLLFLAPGFLALWLYQHPNYVSKVTTNKGQLLTQPNFRAKALTGSWGLVLWQPQVCDEPCFQILNKLHRIRLALGRQYYETHLWLAQPRLSEKGTQNLTRMSSSTAPFQTLAVVSKKELERLGQQPWVFLSNPQGYFILAYSPQGNAQDIYQDLKHLLKINEKAVSSQIKG